MNKDDLTLRFRAVQKSLDFDEIAIIEKDYFVVKLLTQISKINSEHYSIVFAGGTSLTKMDIGIDRISEDVDIKLIPKDAYLSLSGNQKRKAKKNIRQQIIDGIALTDGLEAISEKSITRDTGRYYQLPISYDNSYKAPAYMRADIKLELIETDLLAPPSLTPISSMVSKEFKELPEIDGILTNNWQERRLRKYYHSSGERQLTPVTPAGRTMKLLPVMSMTAFSSLRETSADKMSSLSYSRRPHCSILSVMVIRVVNSH